jgi:ABC-type transporter lipoprotein component MlaA
LHEVLGPASVKEKLDLVVDSCGYSRIDKDFSLSVDEKLCCHAMEVANKYNNHHELMSDAPSMHYSLIREIPEFFSQFIVDDRADQQMKKRQRV